MKEHFCKQEKTIIGYEGECNWCGEKEMKHEDKLGTLEEPVAYVNNMCNDSIDWIVDPMKLDEGTPLYTAPRELSDEEIEEVYQSNQFEGYITKQDCIDFARAILKKASEK